MTLTTDNVLNGIKDDRTRELWTKRYRLSETTSYIKWATKLTLPEINAMLKSANEELAEHLYKLSQQIARSLPPHAVTYIAYTGEQITSDGRAVTIREFDHTGLFDGVDDEARNLWFSAYHNKHRKSWLIKGIGGKQVMTLAKLNAKLNEVSNCVANNVWTLYARKHVADETEMLTEGMCNIIWHDFIAGKKIWEIAFDRRLTQETVRGALSRTFARLDSATIYL